MARRELRTVARSVTTARIGYSQDRPPSAWTSSALAPARLDRASASVEFAIAAPPAELHDVMRLRSMRQHLKAIDNAHGGGAALPMATWYLEREVSPLLDR
jgi:hypothetical protein